MNKDYLVLFNRQEQKNVQRKGLNIVVEGMI